MSNDDLANRFGFHPTVADTQVKVHENVRAILATASGDTQALMPPGREASLFLTKMEEAMFWANAAIARERPLG